MGRTILCCMIRSRASGGFPSSLEPFRVRSWNVSFESLLRNWIAVETRLVSYSDDDDALIAARNIRAAQLRLSTDTQKVNGRALSKTQIVKHIKTYTSMSIGDLEIKTIAKYREAQRTVGKTTRGFNSLGSLMANVDRGCTFQQALTTLSCCTKLMLGLKHS